MPPISMCAQSATGEAILNGPALIAPSAIPINQHTFYIPLRPLIFAQLLSNYPDQAFVSKTQSLASGFNIGYNGPHDPLITPNLLSASLHLEVVDDVLTKEVSENRIAGPYQHPPLPNMWCSGLWVVPKKDGGWLIIYHKSAPVNNGINDYIDPDTYSLQ